MGGYLVEVFNAENMNLVGKRQISADSSEVQRVALAQRLAKDAEIAPGDAYVNVWKGGLLVDAGFLDQMS